MEIINPNGVKIYNLSCGKPIPDVCGRYLLFYAFFSVFLVPVEEEEEGIGQGRVYLPSDSFCSMKLYHLAYRTRIELIQGYEFNSACSKIKLSKDGQYIIASGMLVSCLLRIE